MNIAVAITTAPRPVPTLNKSIQSFRQAGFDEKIHIFADGISPEVEDQNVSIIVNEPKLEELANWFSALDYLLSLNTDWVMLIQDDATWAKNSKKQLEKDLEHVSKLPDVGFYSLFTHRTVYKRLPKETGIHCINREYRGDGAVCYVFPRDAAMKLAEEPANRQWHTKRNTDNVVSGRLNDMGYNTYYRIPSMINHTLGSANSSLKPKSPDDTPSWVESF